MRHRNRIYLRTRAETGTIVDIILTRREPFDDNMKATIALMRNDVILYLCDTNNIIISRRVFHDFFYKKKKLYDDTARHSHAPT